MVGDDLLVIGEKTLQATYSDLSEVKEIQWRDSDFEVTRQDERVLR